MAVMVDKMVKEVDEIVLAKLGSWVRLPAIHKISLNPN